MLHIHEQFSVDSDARTVWAVISDPWVVVDCVPGAILGGQRDDGSFDAAVTVKLGPVKVAFQAVVSLELDATGMVGHVSARGKDSQGGTRVGSTMTFTVREEAESRSGVTIDSDVEISGRLAGVIETGASIVVARMSSEFAENLAKRCAGGRAG